MLNTQKKETFNEQFLEFLDIQAVFYTLQGEGVYTGHPAVFIRMAGCNLQCPLCDTDYTSNRQSMHVNEIASYVLSFVHAQVVVLTGGEPLRQNSIALLKQLAEKIPIQIETNGSRCPSWASFNQKLISKFVISPKTPSIDGEFGKQIEPERVMYKYVIEAGKVGEDGLPTNVLGIDFSPARPLYQHRKCPVYLQPLWVEDPEQRQANMNVAVQSCMEYGYRLSLQTHKIVGLP